MVPNVGAVLFNHIAHWPGCDDKQLRGAWGQPGLPGIRIGIGVRICDGGTDRRCDAEPDTHTRIRESQ